MNGENAGEECECQRQEPEVTASTSPGTPGMRHQILLDSRKHLTNEWSAAAADGEMKDCWQNAAQCSIQSLNSTVHGSGICGMQWLPQMAPAEATAMGHRQPAGWRRVATGDVASAPAPAAADQLDGAVGIFHQRRPRTASAG